MTVKIRMILILLTTLVCLSGAKLFAQNPVTDSTATQPDQTKKEAALRLLLDQIEVKGWIEKPQMVFVVPGVNPEIDDIVLDRSFLNEMMRPLDKDQFEGQKILNQKMVIPW